MAEHDSWGLDKRYAWSLVASFSLTATEGCNKSVDECNLWMRALITALISRTFLCLFLDFFCILFCENCRPCVEYKSWRDETTIKCEGRVWSYRWSSDQILDALNQSHIEKIGTRSAHKVLSHTLSYRTSTPTPPQSEGQSGHLGKGWFHIANLQENWREKGM